MNELKAKLMSLGISEEQTEQAILAVADFAKSKIPVSFHGPLDDVLAGKSPDLSGLLGGLGGLFGK